MELIGYALALLSALALATGVIGDTLMMEKVYGRPSQPLFISSILDAFFGLIATFVAMFYFDIPFLKVPWHLTGWAFLSGVLSWITLWFYFSALAKEQREPSEVAAWIASTPVWILVASAALYSLDLDFPNGALTKEQWLGVLLVTAGLMLLPVCIRAWQGIGSARYRFLLLGIVIANSLYTVIMAMVIGRMLSLVPTSSPLPELTASLNLMPPFWFGVLSGCVVMLIPRERRILNGNAGTLAKHWKYIILLEIAGMTVFWAEVLALGFIHPVLTALIAGVHPVIVLALSIFVRRRGCAVESAFPAPRYQLGTAVLLFGLMVGFLFALR